MRFKSILAHIESRLGQLADLPQKLLRVPLDLDYPYWVEDENFDLEYHVRHIALPKPGDWRQFCIQASRIHARPLDLNRPLWEIYVIEGLDSLLDLPEGSFALLTKIHHAAIDVEQRHRDHDAAARPDAAAAAAGAAARPGSRSAPPGTLALLLPRRRAHSLLSPLRLAHAAGARAATAPAPALHLRRRPAAAAASNCR